MSKIYFCTIEDNECIKKDTCKRYVENNNEECHICLYKNACTEENNHVLYIRYEKLEEGEKQ